MNGINKKTPRKSRCFIFIGGKGFSPEFMTDIPQDGDFIIAADSGIASLLCFSERMKKILPNVIVGDMDSFPREEMDRLFPDIPFLPFPPEKDDTDTALAVNIAIDRGFSDIVIAGGMGGRCDHSLANIFLLESIREKGGHGIITDGKNRCSLAQSVNIFDGEILRKYVSVIPIDKEVSGLVMTGFKYPLDGVTLRRGSTLCVSNERISGHSEIIIEKGTALIAETSD